MKESQELSQYNNILEQAYRHEDNMNELYSREIQSKSNIFEIIKSNCQENFNFILKYPNRNNIVTSKLSVLITHIQDYKKNFNSKTKNDFNNTSNDKIKTLLNKTFTIDNRRNMSTSFYNN